MTREGEGYFHLPHHAVARTHTAIELTEAGYALLDLHSRGGTSVNSRQVLRDRPTILREGDRIKICDFGFEFHEEDPPAVTPRPASAPPTPRA